MSGEISDMIIITETERKIDFDAIGNANFKASLRSFNGENSLDLRHCKITNKEVIDFVIPFLREHPEIEYLDISCNNIGDVGAQALAEITGLKTLYLFHNPIGNAGAQALAANTGLLELHLGANLIDDAGAQAFGNNTTLKILSLSCNQIGNAGAQALAGNKGLTNLYMVGNPISGRGVDALKKWEACRRNCYKGFLPAYQSVFEGKNLSVGVGSTSCANIVSEYLGIPKERDLLIDYQWRW